MRTLAQVCEDHAAACSRAAGQTDDPVFRKMLLNMICDECISVLVC